MSGKREGKRIEEKKKQENPLPSAVLKGGLLAVAVMLAVLLAGAGAISVGWLGQEMMSRWGMLACVAGSLAGGLAAARQERRWALLLGLGIGGMLFGLLLLAGLALYEGAPEMGRIPGILCSCLCGGGMAGILGRKSRKKRKR